MESECDWEIPKGWCWVQHKQIAEINPKLPLDVTDETMVSFVPMAAVEALSGKVDCTLLRQYGDVKKGYTPFIDGDLILAKITPCMENGKVAVLSKLHSGIGCGSTEFHVSRLNTEAVDVKFIFYYFLQESFRRKARQHMTGSAGQLRVPKTYFECVYIPVPPLAEQRRIVAKIEELFSDLDAGVQTMRKAQEQLKVYRQSVLKWAFEGRLTEDWRLKSQHAREAAGGKAFLSEILKSKKGTPSRTQTKLKGSAPDFREVLPDTWCTTTVGEILLDIEAGKSFICDERPPKQHEVGVAKVSAVTWGEYNELESKTCMDNSRINQQLFIGAGDFLFSRANTIELVGASVIAKHVNLRVMLSDKTLRLKFAPGINPSFLLFFFRSPIGRRQIEDLSTGNQESMRNIGQERIKSITLPFPSKQEQNLIVQEIERRFSICQMLELALLDCLEKSSGICQSVLKHAFEGRLVPQDPTDEPAEELIKRIHGQMPKEIKPVRAKVKPSSKKQSRKLVEV